jgi:hypothetical protein
LPAPARRKTTEKIVKKFLLAAAFTSVFAAGAIAQNGLSPRDPPFGKGDASNDTMHEPNSAGPAYNSNNGLAPRDPPFGKGNAENDTMHQPNSARATRASNQSILPKDPPFGKGM